MKRILLGTAVVLALLTGCSDEKKAPIQTETTTQDVKKDEVVATQNEATEAMAKDEVTTEAMAKDEVVPVEDETTKEESK
jgi:hypothetical protein